LSGVQRWSRALNIKRVTRCPRFTCKVSEEESNSGTKHVTSVNASREILQENWFRTEKKVRRVNREVNVFRTRRLIIIIRIVSYCRTRASGNWTKARETRGGKSNVIPMRLKRK
jgi:hypothetical protein